MESMLAGLSSDNLRAWCWMGYLQREVRGNCQRGTYFERNVLEFREGTKGLIAGKLFGYSFVMIMTSVGLLIIPKKAIKPGTSHSSSWRCFLFSMLEITGEFFS